MAARSVYLGVKTCEVFLCFVAIVRVRVYYVVFFVFFVLRHWWVSQVLTPRMSLNFLRAAVKYVYPGPGSRFESRLTLTQD